MLRGGAASRGFPSSSARGRQNDRACPSTHYISCLHLLSAVGADDTGFQRIVIEGFLELLARPVQAGHDCPYRHPERRGGVLVGEPFDGDQEDDLAAPPGELLARGHDLGGGQLVET